MVWKQSRTARVLRTITERATRASRESVLRGAAESLATRGEAIVRGSYCYRWLTAAPDPSVVVIDLRETRTVGPFVRLLETALDPVERAWAESRASTVSADLERVVARSRTGQLLAALLEPPEQPEDEREGGERE